MSGMGCLPTTTSVTELLTTPEVQAKWRELRHENAPAIQFVQALCEFAPPDIAATMLEEFQVLPSLVVTTVADAWALADAAGKPFQFASVLPTEPLAFARHRRVRVIVDTEEDSVTVFLSHVPTRHADWYGLSQNLAAVSAG